MGWRGVGGGAERPPIDGGLGGLTHFFFKLRFKICIFNTKILFLLLLCW